MHICRIRWHRRQGGKNYLSTGSFCQEKEPEPELPGYLKELALHAMSCYAFDEESRSTSDHAEERSYLSCPDIAQCFITVRMCMESLVTCISILQVLWYGNFFQLRNTQLLIDRDIFLVALCIHNPTNTLSRDVRSFLSSWPTVKCSLIFFRNQERNSGVPLMMRSST